MFHLPSSKSLKIVLEKCSKFVSLRLITLPVVRSFDRVPGEFYNIFQSSLSSECNNWPPYNFPHLDYKLDLGFQILKYEESSPNKRLTWIYISNYNKFKNWKFSVFMVVFIPEQQSQKYYEWGKVVSSKI